MHACMHAFKTEMPLCIISWHGKDTLKFFRLLYFFLKIKCEKEVSRKDKYKNL